MPTYQYACRDCGHAFEQVQSFSDAALSRCPACEGSLRKVFSAVGVVFKGSGFYRNDSRAPAKSADGSSPSEGGTKTDAAPKTDGAPKGDAKPAPAAAASGPGSAKAGSSSGGGTSRPSSTAGNAA